jgi:hypothetical protein
MRLNAVAGYGLLALIALFFAYIAWTKPECRSGNVALFGFGTGWVCITGYKP